jgi:FKBP-type peptidyl-prolyl cis-trans isomerase
MLVPGGYASNAPMLVNLFTRPMRLSRIFVALAPLALAACLNTTEPPAYATVEGTTFAPALGVDLTASTRTPSGLYYRDIVVGTGTAIVAGQQGFVYFVGNLSSGEQFTTLKSPAAPQAVTPGTFALIEGFEEGVVGMKVGGRRQLLIPPSLAYGLYTQTDNNGNVVIPSNSVLVFTVDAVDASGAGGAP